MIYALRSPETRLDDRLEIAERIKEAVENGNREALRGDPMLVYVGNELLTPNIFCIYCNTAVIHYRWANAEHYKHNHWRGGIRREQCEQIARVLGMNPVYDQAPYPAKE